MNELSLTQKYLLCVLNGKGRIPTFGIEKNMCIAASSVVELLMDGIVELEDNKLTVKRNLPDEKRYLRSVFDFIEKRQPVKFERVVEDYSITFTDKNSNELIGDVGESLVEAGYAQKDKGGLFGRKDLYVPDERAVDRVIQNIRAEILEEGEISEDIVALSVLLQKSGDLSKYFSAYEKKSLKKRLKEIKEHPVNKEVARVIDYVDTMLMMVIVAAT